MKKPLNNLFTEKRIAFSFKLKLYLVGSTSMIASEMNVVLCVSF